MDEKRCHAGVILTAEFPLENMSDLSRCILVPVHEKLELTPFWIPAVIGDMLRVFFTWFSAHHIEALKTLTDSFHKGWKPKLETRVRTNYICLKWAFHLAYSIEKLKKKDGVMWKDDLCIRPQRLLSFVRQQPGYHQYTCNQLTQELMDLGALVI